MKKTFFARYSLLILMVIFFLVPFSLRGARLAIQNMGNDVKEWLPEKYSETKDLEWFRDNFLGEQFIAVTWDGCTGLKDDQTLKTFVGKLAPELPPSLRGEGYRPKSNEEYFDKDLGLYVRQVTAPEYAALGKDLIQDQLGLYVCKAYEPYENWGGENEKWLKGSGDKWYYITPAGDLYRWNGGNNLFGAIVRKTQRLISGHNTLSGTLEKSFGPADGPWYYADPRRLNARLFKTVSTGPSVLNQLTREGGPLSGSEEEEAIARERLTGTLFGPNGKQTCVLLTLSEIGQDDLHRILGRGALGRPRGLLPELGEEIGLRYDEIRFGGPPVDNVAIDEEGSITLYRLVGWAGLIGFSISLLCLRSWKLTLMVFFVGGVSAVTSIAAIWWCGSTVDAIVLSMPPLVYVLGLSGAVHIVNYYRDAVAEHGLVGAPELAVSHGWRPCTLAAFTTAIGLLSLTTSEIIPIQKFGIFSAIGVVGTLILLFLYLPAAMEMWPPKRIDLVKKPTILTKTYDWYSARMDRFILWFARGLVRYNVVVAMGCTLLMIAFALGLPRINTSIQLLKLFDKDAKIINDYAWMEQHLGQLIPLEMVIHVRPEWRQQTEEDDAAAVTASDASKEQEKQDAAGTAEAPNRFALNFLERMEMVQRLQRVVEEEFGPRGNQVVGKAMGAPSFAIVLPGYQSTGDRLIRGGVSRSLEKHRDEFAASDYLRYEKVLPNGKPIPVETKRDERDELWRVSLRLGALKDVDYGHFVDELKKAVEPVMTAYRFRNTVLPLAFEHRGDTKRPLDVLLLCGPTDEPPPPDAAKAEQALDQTHIFTETLSDVLQADRAAVVQQAPFSLDYATSEGWKEYLDKQDCVVLIEDNPCYDVAFLKQVLGDRLIDARDHGFDAAAGSQTARELAEQGKADIFVTYTGIVPIVYKAQRALLHSLIRSIGWSFVLISFVMMILLRSFRAGLIAMMPNVFPVVLIFGAMGWSDIMVDVGSMMTASVALGIAVDDTIHFLTWFRWELDQGRKQGDAIIAAYQRVSRAMFQTTAIGGLGLFVFAASTFTPTQRFGVMMLALLAAALMGDLIFLPALLAGPLGRVFRPSAKDSHQEKHGQKPVGDTQPTAPPEESASSPQPEQEPVTRYVPAPKSDDSSSVLRRDRAH